MFEVLELGDCRCGRQKARGRPLCSICHKRLPLEIRKRILLPGNFTLACEHLDSRKKIYTKHKAVEIPQPWASAMLLGLKLHDTKTWATDYRGPLVIVAPTRPTAISSLPAWFRAQLLHDRLLEERVMRPKSVDHDLHWPKDMPFGVSLGLGYLVDIVPAETIQPVGTDAVYGNFSQGRYAWRIENVQPCRQRRTKPGSIETGIFEIRI